MRIFALKKNFWHGKNSPTGSNLKNAVWDCLQFFFASCWSKFTISGTRNIFNIFLQPFLASWLQIELPVDFNIPKLVVFNKLRWRFLWKFVGFWVQKWWFQNIIWVKCLITLTQWRRPKTKINNKFSSLFISPNVLKFCWNKFERCSNDALTCLEVQELLWTWSLIEKCLKINSSKNVIKKPSFVLEIRYNSFWVNKN